MSAAGPGIDNTDPGAALELAGAIAERLSRYHILTDEILTELNGQPVGYDAEEIRQVSFGRTVLFLASVGDEASGFSASEYLDAGISPNEYKELANEIMRDVSGDDDISPDGPLMKEAESVIRDFAKNALAKVLEDMGWSDDTAWKDFARLLRTARILADEKGVKVAEVYQSDNYYFEAERRSRTIEERASTYIDMLQAMGEETLRNIAEMAISIVPVEILDELDPEELAQLKDEVIRAMQAEAESEQSEDTHREVLRQTFTYFAIRTYGSEALDGLPLDIQAELTPARPLTSPVIERLI